MPYLPAEKVADFVISQWQHLRFSPALIAAVRRSVHEELADQESKDEVVLTTQRRRLQQLERTRSKLLDAYLAEAIPVSDLKARQAALAAEQREAERLIELASANHQLARSHVEAALACLNGRRSGTTDHRNNSVSS